MKLPRSITVNTGEQGSMAETIDDFFIEARDHIIKRCGALPFDFLLESGELARHGTTITDNRMTYLKYRDRVVAIVTETRTVSNYVQYDFFLNFRDLEMRGQHKDV